jgi:hypothetical protein
LTTGQNLDARQLHKAGFVIVFQANCNTFHRGTMGNKNENTTLGKLVFTLTAMAMLYFFWWLLIFDHGVIPHH